MSLLFTPLRIMTEFGGGCSRTVVVVIAVGFNILSGPFQACNLSARQGEVAAFGTCIRFVAEQPETHVSWNSVVC